MTSDIMPFSFENQAVRVVHRNGEPWFVVADVCHIIGAKQPSHAVAPLDGDEKGVTLCHTPGGPQELLIVSESGLYTIVVRSRKAMTPGTVQHRFRRWVMSEVLPTIRKTGGYGVNNSQQIADLEKKYVETLERLMRFTRAYYALRATTNDTNRRQELALALVRSTGLNDEEIAAQLPPTVDGLPRIGFVADIRRWVESGSPGLAQ